jgi:hypothetical protein
VQKVMWTVAELGLPHQRVDAGMAHGVVNEPWYADSIRTGWCRRSTTTASCCGNPT